MKTKVALLFVASMFPAALSAQQHVPPDATVFVEGSGTVDASGGRAEGIDFTAAVTAALSKKKVPVTVVTDSDRADWVIRHTSSSREDGTAVKLAKAILGGGSTSRFEGSFLVVSRESTAVVFSYNVKKSNFQSAAEAFAKHFKNHIKDGVKKNEKR